MSPRASVVPANETAVKHTSVGLAGVPVGCGGSPLTSVGPQSQSEQCPSRGRRSILGTWVPTEGHGVQRAPWNIPARLSRREVSSPELGVDRGGIESAALEEREEGGPEFRRLLDNPAVALRQRRDRDLDRLFAGLSHRGTRP